MEFSRSQMEILKRLGNMEDHMKQLFAEISRIVEDKTKIARPNFSKFQKHPHPLLSTIYSFSEVSIKGVISDLPMTLSSSHLKERNQDRYAIESIIGSLSFTNFSHRESAIPKPHSETFQWLFTHDQSTFGRWLEESDKLVYWVTGKPGSGKSTLMKFMSQNPLLKDGLETWSDGLPLLLAGFYFWNAGTDLEKSQEGLLKSILYQCLRQMPSLVPRIFARRYTLVSIFGDNIPLPEWTWEDLEQGIQSLASLSGQLFKLALFIDGLDEFEGNHAELANIMKEMACKYEVKVCVSSRPWNVFSDAFKQNPSLKMEDLTERDIRRYVTGQLESNQGFCDRRDIFPNQAAELVNGVVNKARGVFLWVTIVVKRLLTGLTEGDSLSDLLDTLNEVPDNLSGLYNSIWDSIKEEYRSDSSKIFQILRACESPLDAFTFWVALEDHPENIYYDKPSASQYHGVIKIITRRLASRTKGLLEVSKSNIVDFLHRTAHDWVY